MVRRSAAPNLLRPYPHFGGTFAVERYEGSDSYNAGTIQLQKRFSNGNSISTQYTLLVAARRAQLPESDGRPARGPCLPNDRPHRFSLGSVMRLPFGHG